MKQDPGGNDIWFGSEESARPPRLVVETEGGGVGPLALDNSPEPAVSVPLAYRQPPLPEIRVTRTGPTELELAWHTQGQAQYVVQMRTSLAEGEWTTLPSLTGSPGTRIVRTESGMATAFFRLIRIDSIQPVLR